MNRREFLTTVSASALGAAAALTMRAVDAKESSAVPPGSGGLISRESGPVTWQGNEVTLCVLRTAPRTYPYGGAHSYDVASVDAALVKAQDSIREHKLLLQKKNPQGQSFLSLLGICGIVKALWREGDRVFARMEMIQTDAGKAAQVLLRAGLSWVSPYSRVELMDFSAGVTVHVQSFDCFFVSTDPENTHETVT